MTSPLIAQEAVLEIVDESTAASPGSGYSLPVLDRAALEAHEEFREHLAAAKWEKAFQVIGRFFDEPPEGMIDRGDGFQVPFWHEIWHAMVELPASGRQAFRVFYDAKARRHWEAASATDDPTAARAELATIHRYYFITSFGDQATNRLAELAFQRGAFTSARHLYGAVIDHHPDTDLSLPLLHAKRLTAIAREGQASVFDRERRALLERYPDVTIRVAGRDQTVAEFVATLEVGGARREAEVARRLVVDRGEPRWTIELQDQLQKIKQNTRNWGWDEFSLAPRLGPSCVDDRRLYVNWYGTPVAVSIETGDVVWGGFELGSNAHQVALDRLSIQRDDDELFAVRHVGGGREYPLVCLRADTGGKVWSTRATLPSRSFIGEPLVEYDRVFAIAHPHQGHSLDLMCLDRETGDTRWQLELGTPVGRSTGRFGEPVLARPHLARVGAVLVIQTNGGAVIAVDPRTRTIDWAFTYPTEIGRTNGFVVRQRTEPVAGSSGLIVADGLVYAKPEASRWMYAIDAVSGRVTWRRRVSKGAALVACSNGQLLLAGEELSVIDARDRRLLWSNRFPIGDGGAGLLIDRSSIFVYSRRGIYELDRSNGDKVGAVLRNVDRRSPGGRLWWSGEVLVAVSARGIVAYDAVADDARSSESTGTDLPPRER